MNLLKLGRRTGAKYLAMGAALIALSIGGKAAAEDIYIIKSGALHRYNTQSGNLIHIAPLDTNLPPNWIDGKVSPDGRLFLYEGGEGYNSDIKVMDTQNGMEIDRVGDKMSVIMVSGEGTWFGKEYGFLNYGISRLEWEDLGGKITTETRTPYLVIRNPYTKEEREPSLWNLGVMGNLIELGEYRDGNLLAVSWDKKARLDVLYSIDFRKKTSRIIYTAEKKDHLQSPIFTGEGIAVLRVNEGYKKLKSREKKSTDIILIGESSSGVIEGAPNTWVSNISPFNDWIACTYFPDAESHENGGIYRVMNLEPGPLRLEPIFDTPETEILAGK